MLPKLCHLDNDLEIISIIPIQYASVYYIYSYCVVHDLHTLPGDFFILTVPQCGRGP